MINWQDVVYDVFNGGNGDVIVLQLMVDSHCNAFHILSNYGIVLMVW